MAKLTIVLLAVISVFLPAEAIIYTCIYEPYEYIGDKPGYACTATLINVTLNALQITVINGVSAENLKSNRVRFSHTVSTAHNCQMLKTVPQRLEIFFPNMDVLSLLSCGTNKLNENDLAKYTKLRRLDIVSSYIEYVPRNFFAHTPNMEKINFNSNRIQSVGFGLLNNLKVLDEAVFYGEKCISKTWYLWREPIEPFLYELQTKCLDNEPETTTIAPQCSCDESFGARILQLENKNKEISVKLGEIAQILN